MQFKNQKGQAVLIVLLSLSVVLVMVLSIMSRSITDLSLSSKEEDSSRAFSAAEAGIERALVIGAGSSGVLEMANFDASVTSFASGQSSVVSPISLKSGETATFWLSRSGEAIGFTGSSIKFCWGNEGTSAVSSDTPAIEVSVYYKTLAGEYRVGRKLIDPNTGGRTQNNGYVASGTCSVGGETFQFQNTVSLDASGLNIANYSTQGVLQYATARILYNTAIAHKISTDVSGIGSVLPSQGTKVISSGSFANANRKIEVYQLHSEIPTIFTNAIFSSLGIIK